MTITAWSAALPRHWSWRRLLVAVGVSVLVHVLVASRWHPSGGMRQDAAVTPQLQARLEAPAEPLVVPAAERPDIPLESAPAKPLARVPAPVERAAPSAPAAAGGRFTADAGVAVPDPRFYPARELDRYPVPLAPLDLRTATAGPGSVRFWLNIDLAGNVVDAVVVDADRSVALTSMAREYLLATRFVPAVKDGRPVKSRVLLELRYGN